MASFLTNSEREWLLTQHKIECDKRVCDRIKAVLLYDKGWSYKQIAEALLLNSETIRMHIEEYCHSNKLKTLNGGSSEKFSKSETNHLLEHLEENVYLFAKDIVTYAKKMFGVSYTLPGITQWLKRHGFSYKKPAVVPGKACHEVQKLWIESYKYLKNNLPKGEAICFMDGVDPTHNMRTAYGWIKKGIRRELPTNTGRERLNISGAVDINTKKVFIQEDKTLNAKSTTSFLQKVAERYPEASQIHLFCDNARYYRNKKVTDFLEASKITLHFLPPYSPNLNPIERLWKLMNENVINNRYYEKFQNFKEAVLGFLEGLNLGVQGMETVLKSRLTENFRPVGSR